MDNVEGAQKELLKYWSRVSGNRWLIAKMFGVLVCQRLCLFTRTTLTLSQLDDIFPALGVDRRVDGPCAMFASLYSSFPFTTCAGVTIDYGMVDFGNTGSTRHCVDPGRGLGWKHVRFVSTRRQRRAVGIDRVSWSYLAWVSRYFRCSYEIKVTECNR